MRKLFVDVVMATDRWVHFHRFQARPLCDLVDRLIGAPADAVAFRRRVGDPAHTALAEYRSKLRHPSHEVST